MTEMEQWLVDNNVQYSELMRGYEMFGRSIMDLIQVDQPLKSFRREAISLFSFAILTIEVVEKIKPHGPLLEIGSGTGYWAYELRKAGVDIIATDPSPYRWVNVKPAKIWTEVEELTAEEALKKYQGRTLLLCWPSYDEDWAAQALEQYRIQGGQKLVHFGEYRAATANERFFDLLEADWKEVETIPTQNWEGVHDYGSVYERK